MGTPRFPGGYVLNSAAPAANRTLAAARQLEFNQALQEADVKDRLSRLGIEPVGGTPQQFTSMANADRAKWKKIIIDRKIAAE